MSWWEYVARIAKTDRQRDISDRVPGLDPSAVSRWKSGHVPKADMVALFARGYDRPVLEAFLAAGFLTPEEAKARPSLAPDFSRLSNDELLELVRERMGESDGTATKQAGGSPAPTAPPHLKVARTSKTTGSAGQARAVQDEEGEAP